jgi:predicted membrane-bound spermidine synthase
VSRKVKRKVIPVQREAVPVDPPVRFLAVLAFLAGCAALVYQVLWVRQIDVVVSVDVYAVTTCVSAFFAGMALGSFLFGHLADRLPSPLFAYALLECGIAVAGVLATLVLSRAEALFVSLQQSVGPAAWLLPFVLVGIPAILIGGTLPLLFRAWSPEAHIAAGGGFLYAANTAGGILGALAASFFLIGRFGMRGSSLAAAFLNLCVAAGAFALVKKMAPHEGTRPVPENSAPETHQRLALQLYCFAGGIALGYEVVWTQAIVPFMSTRSFAFAVVLATYLLGLVIGSAFYARLADRLDDALGSFAVLLSVAGLLAFLQVVGLGHWLLVLQTQAEAIVREATGNFLAGVCARFAVAAASVVLLPTVLLGAAFPVVLRLAVGARQIGRDVGQVLAFNTLGGILGTLFTGFVLVPALGLVRTLAALAIGACTVGILAVLRGSSTHDAYRNVVFATAGICVVCAVLASPDSMAKALTVARGGGEVVFYQESASGTVAVLQESKEKGDFRRLYIQGVSNSGDAMPSLRYMRLQALLPLLIMDHEPKSALVIGYGTGITSGALLVYKSLEKRVCVELLPGVVSASSKFRGNLSAASNRGLQIRIGDGRHELLRSADRYDLITLEPPPPSAVGVANLYSTNFYQLAAKRLQPGGMVAQWLPLGAQNDEDSRALVRSFLDVFPYATLWTTEMHEMLLVGSFQPIRLDAERITRRFEAPDVAAALREVGISSPAALLATWVTNREGLEKYAANMAPVTDGRPSVEYSTWVRPAEASRVLPELLALRTDPPLQNANGELLAAVRLEGENLREFYEAGLAAYRGEREVWARSIQRVLAQDGQNPYYRWTVYGR